MYFNRQAFLGQVPLVGQPNLGQGMVYAGDVSFAGDQICTILGALDAGMSTPREYEIYRSEFNRWYSQVGIVDWKEAQLTQYVASRCPEGVRTFNLMRSGWMAERAQPEQPPEPPEPPIPPAGPPVASVDPYTRYRDLRPSEPATTTAPMVEEERPDTPTGGTGPGGCPIGQFPAYPGGPCRGPMAPGAANLVSQALQYSPGAAEAFGFGGGGFGMSGRFPVMNLVRER